MFSTLLGKIGWSDLPTSFGYIIDKECLRRPCSVFNLHSGRAKHDSSKEVSIFYHSSNDSTSEIARRTMHKSKCIKHPSFLSVHEAVSVASGVYIVTDKVKSLADFALESGELLRHSLPWNLARIIEGLEFLHSNVGSVHGLINPDFIFVSESGQWFIGGFEICSSKEDLVPFNVASFLDRMNQHPPSHIDPALSKMPRSASPYCIDRYNFAALAAWASAIKHTHIPSSFSFDTNSKSLDPSLQRICKRLTDTSHANADTFEWNRMITDLPYFYDSDIYRVMSTFSGIALKGNWDKEIFFDQTLPEIMDKRKLHQSVWTHMVLPYVLSQIKAHGNPPSLIPKLISLFVRIISLIDSTPHFIANAEAAYITLMKSSERSTRYILLASLSSFERHLSVQTAMTLFPSLCQGLSDSASELRDATIRAMLVFIPKISQNRSLLDRGIKLLSQAVQTDHNPEIRTNCVICLAKLSIILPSEIVRTSIAPVFLIGMKDEFSPCRLASIQALGAVSPLLTPHDIAFKFLPAISTRLVDPCEECKSLAFSTAEFLLTRIRALDNGAKDDPETQALPSMALRILRSAAWGTSRKLSMDDVGSAPTVDTFQRESSTDLAKMDLVWDETHTPDTQSQTGPQTHSHSQSQMEPQIQSHTQSQIEPQTQSQTQLSSVCTPPQEERRKSAAELVEASGQEEPFWTSFNNHTVPPKKSLALSLRRKPRPLSTEED